LLQNKIKAASIKLLWEKLSQAIATTLKQQKGVLLPNLGNFRVRCADPAGGGPSRRAATDGRPTVGF
jgi:nucleoid DNA-binding protein